MADYCAARMVVKNQFMLSNVTVSPAPAAGYPANNMLMTWRSRVMRTSGVSNQRISFALPESQQADAFFCPVSGQVELRLELFSDPGMMTRVYDSGITKFGVQTEQLIPLGRWAFGVNSFGQTEGITAGAARVLYFGAVRYQAARVTLNWAASPLGYIEVPYLVIGQAFRPKYGASTGVKLSMHNNRQKRRTRGGSLLRTGLAAQWRELQLDLNYLSEDERTRLHEEIAETAGEAVLIDAYPLNTGKLHDHHLFLADLDLPEFSDNASSHAVPLLFQEV